jgi:hypothetical protein
MNRPHCALTALACAGALVVSACSTGAATSAPPTTASSSSTQTSSGSSSSTGLPPNTTVIRVTIHGKTVTPAPGNVDLAMGTTLRLIVTSDHDDQLHAHGFEVETNLKAGQPTTMDLKATNPGVYEIETHHPPLTLMRVVVR